MEFQSALKFVLQREGGFVDDPADHGGRTNFGITQKTYDKWLNAKGHEPTDVKNIPESDVHSIYYENYWLASKVEALPGKVRLVYFDCCVNSGQDRAAKLLQEAVGVPADGQIGPMTLSKIKALEEFDVACRYLVEREEFYRQLSLKPGQHKFLRGWLIRIHKLADEIGVNPTWQIDLSSLQ